MPIETWSSRRGYIPHPYSNYPFNAPPSVSININNNNHYSVPEVPGRCISLPDLGRDAAGLAMLGMTVLHDMYNRGQQSPMPPLAPRRSVSDQNLRHSVSDPGLALDSVSNITSNRQIFTQSGQEPSTKDVEVGSANGSIVPLPSPIASGRHSPTISTPPRPRGFWRGRFLAHFGRGPKRG